MKKALALQNKIDALEQLLDVQEKSIIEQTDRLVESGAVVRQSEEKFKILFEQAADIILLLEITPEGMPVIREANSATFRLLGYERDELIGRPVSFINAASDDSKVVNARRQNVLSGTGTVFEAKHRCKDGTIRDFECSATEMQVGSKTLAISVERDITKRKQAELALQKSEAIMRGIYLAAPVGISVANNRITQSVNGWLCEISGFSAEELIGKSARIYFPDDAEYERVGRELYGCRDRGSRGNVEARLRCKDGTLVDALVSIAPLDPADPSAGDVVTALDISKRKRAERALAESEQNFRRMFEITSEGVALICPKTGRFIAANPAMCAMFGYSEEEFHLLTPEDITPPEAIEIMRMSMKTLFDGGIVPDHEGISIKKDGTKVNVIVSNRNMSWKGEYVFHITFKDVTFLKAIQEQLKKKNSEVLEFTNLVTHDLRKPLTTMNIVLGLAKKNAFGTLNPDGVDAIDTGIEASHYMQEMLEDLLACARLESGTQELVIEETRLGELVEAVLMRMKYQIEEKKIQVVSPDKDISVMADKKQLTRVLMNLVGNAVNYIGSGPDKFIRIGWEQTNGAPVFMVADNGIGVPEKSQKDLFMKFKRGSNVSGVQGTGLGLSIVKGIVEAHGGKIWFESEVNKGTTFYFTLAWKEANS